MVGMKRQPNLIVIVYEISSGTGLPRLSLSRNVVLETLLFADPYRPKMLFLKVQRE